MPVDFPLERRAAIHAALGEPARLAIVDELRVTDRSPGELANLLHLSTNLLTHHLDVLESLGLIERISSSGDRRRKYVRLRHGPPAALDTVSPPRPARTLFLCTHNSARSQLAAALWTTRTGTPAESAGTHPAERVHRGAIAAGRRAGLDLRDAIPRMIDVIDPGAQVVTVCDRAHEELDAPASWWHWSIPDPVERGTPEAFDAVVALLDIRIAALTTDLAPSPPERPHPERPHPERPHRAQPHRGDRS